MIATDLWHWQASHVGKASQDQTGHVMPHQKTNKPQRSEGLRKTSDLAPGKELLKNEAIPKSAARVLNAQKIRDDYRKKRKPEDSGRDEPSSKRRKQEIAAHARKAGKVSLVIQPGESLQHFNRRVEDDLRPLVTSAMKTARSVERNAAKQESMARSASKSKNIAIKRVDKIDTLQDNRDEDVFPALPPSPKNFATALPKRLNDVAQAPPEFKELPRGASSKKGDILPMSQKLRMEKERDKVIQRYRELRASQRPA